MTCVYRRSEAEAPARVEELRHAREEGVEFFFLHGPVEVLTDTEGNVTGMKVEKMALGEPDARGRRRPLPTGERFDIVCDTVISALGTRANTLVTESTPDLALDTRGYIAADDGKLASTQATNLPGVFAGGDIVNGGATVILAMGAGLRAARSIETYLRLGKKWPITATDVADLAPSAVAQEPVGIGPAATEPDRADRPVCPKCRSPLDDGGDSYVCCADARLEWRCESCGKVSEGFAFPYGGCPACGGVLTALDSRRIEGTAALAAIRAAFEIELGGMAFYQRAASETPEPVLKDLFQRFASMEAEHMATLARRYHVDIPSPSDTFQVERAALYAGIASHPDDPINLFRIAIACEERAVEFFTERSEQEADDSPEAVLYRELAAEEREHVAVLTTELDRYRQGKPGLL